uniref:Ig-like domain-containing protein n=1 Tax=Kryptolebias marmoratus TaxID=37003 RepID=A0A3Q3GTR7_KRYMA
MTGEALPHLPPLTARPCLFNPLTWKIIQNVTLSAQPDLAKEGTENITLQYSVLQGTVKQQMWLFNGREVKNGSHYLIERRSLVILGPNRTDTGLYTLEDDEFYSKYGPDEPIVEVHPALPFYEAGATLNLSCQAQGFPLPIVQWMFGGQIVPNPQQGHLILTNVQTSQGGVYKCSLLNEVTKEKQEKNVTLNKTTKDTLNYSKNQNILTYFVIVFNQYFICKKNMPNISYALLFAGPVKFCIFMLSPHNSAPLNGVYRFFQQDDRSMCLTVCV